MNRLSVYSYLARYADMHAGSDRLFTKPSFVRKELIILKIGPVDSLAGSDNSQTDRPTIGLTGSDVGLGTARVR